jgi:type II secretory pathway component PulL
MAALVSVFILSTETGCFITSTLFFFGLFLKVWGSRMVQVWQFRQRE